MILMTPSQKMLISSAASQVFQPHGETKHTDKVKTGIIFGLSHRGFVCQRRGMEMLEQIYRLRAVTHSVCFRNEQVKEGVLKGSIPQLGSALEAQG